MRALEKADDFIALCVGRHPIPRFRREGWCALFNDQVDPFGQATIWFQHLFAYQTDLPPEVPWPDSSSLLVQIPRTPDTSFYCLLSAHYLS